MSASPECIKLIENPSLETIKVYVGNDYKRLWDLNLSNDKQEKYLMRYSVGKNHGTFQQKNLLPG